MSTPLSLKDFLAQRDYKIEAHQHIHVRTIRNLMLDIKAEGSNLQKFPQSAALFAEISNAIGYEATHEIPHLYPVMSSRIQAVIGLISKNNIHFCFDEEGRLLSGDKTVPLLPKWRKSWNAATDAARL